MGQLYIRGLLIAATLTALLTFVIMPHYTRLVKKWLYKESGQGFHKEVPI
jgi:antibiotic biosynthesis monooxygenase (ABM) superfamily enzyme